MKTETFTSHDLSMAEEELNDFVQRNKAVMTFAKRTVPTVKDGLYRIDLMYEARGHRIKTKFN